MKYLHTMVRVHDLEASLGFYRDLLGLVECDRYESEEGQFTLVYLAAVEDLEQVKAERAPLVELTYNWDRGVFPLPRQYLDRTTAKGSTPAACRTLGFDANRR
jgi:lactoylglutathione lyase